MESFLALIVISEVQIKTIDYNFTPWEGLKLKRLITNVGENSEQLELLYIASESVKWYNHFGKMLGSS